jgi:two-component sensor histidine kinase
VRSIHDRPAWRRWPALASVLAIAFVAYGLHLVHSARQVQGRIAQEFRAIDDLGTVAEDLRQLGLVHRVDVISRLYRWPQELDKTRDRIAAIADAPDRSAGLDGLPERFAPLLARLDSLHREQMAMPAGDHRLQPGEVIFQLMLDRARNTVEAASRQVHEKGLKQHTAELNGLWGHARFLLITACLLAVVLAWLSDLSNRLLRQSHRRAHQLEQARHALERSHQELRETMLSKEEKEVMIKEIHHRVKNNLQIVKSLIRFQMDQVDDPRTIELFNECVNRVSAMALVHEHSYLSKDLANIDVGHYLDQLVRDLCHVYTVKVHLELDIRIQVPTMGVDGLVPMGLLINEVISNSLKHAFTDRERGTIMVHLHSDEHGGIELRIGDDGVGLKDRSIWQTPRSLGMELVQTLAGQLDSTVHLEDGPGTVYRVRSDARLSKRRA